MEATTDSTDCGKGEIREEMDFEKMMSEFEKSVRKMKFGKNIDMDAVNTLHSLYFRARKEEIKKLLGDRLAKMRVGVVFKKFWKLLGNATESKLLLQNVCWNYTHVSDDLCEQFGRIGFLQTLISDLEFFTDESGNTEALTSLLAIVFNCARIPMNTKYFKSKHSLETIQKFTSFKDQTIKMVALLTLSHVVDDEHNYLITTDDSVIKNIVLHLKNSVQTIQHKSEGWSTFELVDGLLRLANNNENSASMANEDVVETLIHLMENGREREQEVAGEALWMLCFNEKTKQILLGNEHYMRVLRGLENTDGQGETAVLGILWLLKPEIESDSKPSLADKEVKKKQIMISYQWDNQEVLDQVYEELTKRGYKIWMDIHDMAGSILEAMAGAVEESDIILICMSQKYKNSPNCRTEAEYAFKLRKKIIPLKLEQDYKADGWLGAMVGTKLYTDFSKLQSLQGESFQKKVSKLVLEIDNALNVGKEENNKIPNKSAEKDTLDDNGSKSTSSKDLAIQPTGNVDAEVEKWMGSNKISSLKIAALSIEELRFLRGLMLRAPEVFYNFLSDKLLKEDLVEMMAISKALHVL